MQWPALQKFERRFELAVRLAKVEPEQAACRLARVGLQRSLAQQVQQELPQPALQGLAPLRLSERPAPTRSANPAP